MEQRGKEVNDVERRESEETRSLCFRALETAHSEAAKLRSCSVPPSIRYCNNLPRFAGIFIIINELCLGYFKSLSQHKVGETWQNYTEPALCIMLLKLLKMRKIKIVMFLRRTKFFSFLKVCPCKVATSRGIILKQHCLVVLWEG